MNKPSGNMRGPRSSGLTRNRTNRLEQRGGKVENERWWLICVCVCVCVWGGGETGVLTPPLPSSSSSSPSFLTLKKNVRLCQIMIGVRPGGQPSVCMCRKL